MAYFLLGVLFGLTLTKGELISWFRIQEMFRFQAFHMYGVIASAVAVATISVALIKRLGLRALSGEPIHIEPKRMERGWRYPLGGTLFGIGWAMTGACPGPLVALVGAGVTVMLAAIVAALAGTFVYGCLRLRLPH